MATHDDRHEHFLQGLLCGDFSELDSQLQELATSCDQCRLEIAALTKVTTSLNDSARELELARSLRTDQHDEQARATLLKLAVSGGTVASSPPPSKISPDRGILIPFAIAASVLLCAYWAIVSSDDAVRSGSQMLDGSQSNKSFLCLAPIGAIDGEYGIFRWTAPSTEMEWTYTIQIISDTGSILSYDQLTATEWEIPKDDESKLSDSISWFVYGFDGKSTQPVCVASAECRRN